MQQVARSPRTARASVPALAPALALVLACSAAGQGRVLARTADDLREALADAEPGTQILLAPNGVYEGGFQASDIQGTPRRPVILRSSDPKRPAILRGGSGHALHLSNAAWVELRDFEVEQSKGGGINIDDGGAQSDTRATGVLLSGLTVRDVGAGGNEDGIKLSGLYDFQVEQCRVERWGGRGSAIDMVGCFEGLIENCTLIHEAGKGASGVQIKGGSRDIAVRICRLEHAGSRAMSLGGNTTPHFFRPDPDNEAPNRFEAKDLTVEGCTIIGSETPFACIGIDGCTIQKNTIYQPTRWPLRILQESVKDFVPSRNGSFTRNLFVMDKEAFRRGVNVGPKTEPDSFTFEANAWFCPDASSTPKPSLPTEERRGVHGKRPRFADEEALDLTQTKRSPLRKFGADALD